MSFWYSFLGSYSTTHHLSIGVRLRTYTELGTSTLYEIRSQVEAVATFHVIFGVQMKIVFIIKVCGGSCACCMSGHLCSTY